MDKETEEVMNLVGKSCDGDNSLTKDTSSQQFSMNKKIKKKQMSFTKHRDSQSLQSSIERSKANVTNSKLQAIKNRMDRSVQPNSKEARSTKVQMILERHKRLKQDNGRPQWHNETMDQTRSKIQNLTNHERRIKNNSNMSVQPQSNFLNFTMESCGYKPQAYEEDGTINSNISNKNSTGKFYTNPRYTYDEQMIEEDYASEASQETEPVEIIQTQRDTMFTSSRGASTPTNKIDPVDFKRCSENFSTHNGRKCDFNMNAP